MYGGRPAPAVLSSPSLRRAWLADLGSEGVSTILVGPSAGESQVIRFVDELVGAAGTARGGVVIWTGIQATAEAGDATTAGARDT